MSRRASSSAGPRILLLLVAVVCFLLSAFGVDIDAVNIVLVGFAAFAASFLFP